MEDAREWRAVPGFEGLYDVSNYGEVRAVRRKGSKGGLMAPQVGGRGYLSVVLTKGGKPFARTLHALVAAAFLGPRPDGAEVRHLDGDRLRPHLSNLSYGTRSENQFDRRGHGTDHEANKTHCPQGHVYDGANTYSPPSRPNARYCRACNRERHVARRAAARAAAL